MRKFLSLLLAPLLLGGIVPTGAQGATMTQGAGVALATRQSTGIYSIMNMTAGAKNYETLAMVVKGCGLVEAHMRQTNAGWLPKKSGNSVHPVAASTFGQLIAVGGLNGNVETLPASQKAQFYRLAGVAGPCSAGGTTGGNTGGNTPVEIDVPWPQKCPPMYIRKQIKSNKCYLQSQRTPDRPDFLYGLLRSFNPIASAQAMTADLYVFQLKWDEFNSPGFKYSAVEGYIAFQAGPVSAVWVIDN